ncbi:unnamed protein product [Laminaria digitata]
MALVNVTNVVVLDNPTAFSNPLTFEVTFECLQELDADLEWKVIYVGSAEDTRYDQVLEEVDVGPIPVGVNKFVLTAESPDPATIPSTDLVGVTVTLITCCYKEKEFIRVGYYVNNEHNDPAINAEIQVRFFLFVKKAVRCVNYIAVEEQVFPVPSISLPSPP